MADLGTTLLIAVFLWLQCMGGFGIYYEFKNHVDFSWFLGLLIFLCPLGWIIGIGTFVKLIEESVAHSPQRFSK